MPESVKSLEDAVLKYAAYSAVAISTVAFLLAIPGMFRKGFPLYGRSMSSYFILNSPANADIIEAICGTVVVLLVLSVLSITGKFSGRFKSFHNDSRQPFLRYLLAFVFIEILLSELVDTVNPAITSVYPFDSNLPSVVAAAYASEVLLQSFLFQLIPLFVAIVVALLIRRNLHASSLLNFSLSSGDDYIIAIVVGAAFAILSGGPFIEVISDFFTLFVLNMIFLKAGFLRAFLANFTLSAYNVAAAFLSPYPDGTVLLTVYLVILGFLGAYSLFGMAVRISSASSAARVRSPPERKTPAPDYSRLFVRSSCQECGSTVFHVMDDMSLKCTKCGTTLPPDTMVIPNIRVEIASRPRQ